MSRADIDEILKGFSEWLEIDELRRPKTIEGHRHWIRKLLNRIPKQPSIITHEDVRAFLKEYRNGNLYTYQNAVKAVRVFFRYAGKPEIGKSFKFPRIEAPVVEAPSDEEVRIFYSALERLMDKTFFLIAATSGLRNREIAKLCKKDIDWKTGMIIPRRGEAKRDSTKRTGITFINNETLKILEEYLKTLQTDSDVLFPRGASKDALSRRWIKASEKTGVKITPQMLRVWFCVKMQDLGVAESYIDIFCGRAPKTILARYYTPKGRRRLREVYRRANLKVLG